ncbi:MAG: carboxypeptidase regulatory-like domain-containing protein [Polyangiales bacterium]
MRRAVLAAAALLGCRPAAPRAAPDVAQAVVPQAVSTQPGGLYRVVPVPSPGAIRGVVRWDGPRPAVEPFAVGAVGNPAVCGDAQPSESLVVSDGGGVAFTVLSLDDISAGLAPDPAMVTVDQSACRYIPHVTAVATGVEVRFTNSDRGAIHNVHAYYGYDDDDNWFNATTPFGIATSRVVQRAGVARLTCDAGHFWMLGYLLAFPHPYFAVTDAQGRFEIRGVPPGTYTLRAWHEGLTIARREGTGRRHFSPPAELRRAVTLTAGGAAEVALTLRAGGFAP